MRFFSMVLCAFVLSACGGGSGGGSTSAIQIQFLDSFSRQVELGGSGGFSDGDAGVDGTAGDGAPMVGGSVLLTDANGKTATATTDSAGYYRVKVTGFTPPFIAKVSTSARTLYSLNVTPIKKNGFVTVNLTGLTSKVATDVAVAGGQTGAATLTPQIISANTGVIATSINGLRTQLAGVIASAGLSANTFDPLTVPFAADGTKYDFVLDSTKVAIDANGAAIVSIAPSYIAKVAAYAGTYTGTISGDDTGTFSAVIDAGGKISATATTSGSGNFSASGSITSGGAASLASSGSASTGATFTGTIDANRKFSGTWSNATFGAKGTFTTGSSGATSDSTLTGLWDWTQIVSIGSFTGEPINLPNGPGTSVPISAAAATGIFGSLGTISNYVGCGACGVGSKVTFTLTGSGSVPSITQMSYVRKS